MRNEYAVIAAHLATALAAGGVIGLERSFHGRPAGFRTHALVCLASALLMQFTIYQWRWLPGAPLETVRADPTRLAQGIMTGIGFLGAGVIFKEGLNVRGLTTAASIWVTAAIGILIGIGFYYPAAVTTFLTLATLSVFRWIEDRMPVQSYARHLLRFDRRNPIPEEDVRAFLKKHGFTVANMSYYLTDDGAHFEYRMTIRTARAENTPRLAAALRGLEQVREFEISPVGG
jgi:putative Mg2+ transporter-C (MgtC) family protein